MLDERFFETRINTQNKETENVSVDPELAVQVFDLVGFKEK